MVEGDFVDPREDLKVRGGPFLRKTMIAVSTGEQPALMPTPVSLPEDLIMEAKDIHQRIITIDTHVDFSPANFTDERNYTQRLDTQLNLPKMYEGGLDAVFFSIFVGQTREAQSPDAFMPAGYERAYKAAIEKFDAVHRLVERYAPDKIELALTSADVRRISAAGKKVALMGVENGYPISDDIGRVKEFYDRGAR